MDFNSLDWPVAINSCRSGVALTSLVTTNIQPVLHSLECGLECIHIVYRAFFPHNLSSMMRQLFDSVLARCSLAMFSIIIIIQPATYTMVTQWILEQMYIIYIGKHFSIQSHFLDKQ